MQVSTEASINYNLLFHFSCDHTAWIKTLEGIVMSIQCFGGELPFFFLSGWILRKIGHINAMSLVLLGFGVRFLLYSLLVDPWWVIPIEFMNGITFGLFYATMASYASIVAPPGTEATMQGLVGAVFEGIGVSCGSLLAGNLFNQVGGGQTFRWFGVAALVLFAVHVVIQWVVDRFAARGKQLQQHHSQAEEKVAGNSMLTDGKDELVAGGGGGGGDHVVPKSESVLSESTVQEELEEEERKDEQVEGSDKQAGKVAAKED